MRRSQTQRNVRFLLAVLVALSTIYGGLACAASAPVPLVAKDQSVNWWFVFKFNSQVFPGCGGSADRQCPFGGEAKTQNYPFSQQFVYASDAHPTLQKGGVCLGDTTADPVGATFDEVYNGSFHYVVWNDQFKGDPPIRGCGQSCGAPWGHSKGILAWNDAGDGLVLQVTTPSWPAAGSSQSPRKTDGNTLGCVKDDDVELSQHFFALRLTKEDVLSVLQALQNASVVTDPDNGQVVNNGGPQDIQSIVKTLGAKSLGGSATKTTLSSGVILISKPSRLHVPPWQMVSALLGSVPLRVATFWTSPEIPSTTASSSIGCWDASLGTSSAVENATTGTWEGQQFGLTGGLGRNFNHAKVGVSTSGSHNYAIFGDMNQQGSLSGPNCASSQNGRGGLFYVVDDAQLSDGLKGLLNGSGAPSGP